jgi:hypothetical protein
MNWTEEQLANHLRTRGIAGSPPVIDTSAPPFLPPRNDGFARGKLKPRKMNKTEAAYAQHLNALKLAGDVLWFEFEGIKLRLADDTQYTADFFVLTRDGVLEVHETKGFWRDDARVKIKVAAEKYPFRFFGITKDKTGWAREEFS